MQGVLRDEIRQAIGDGSYAIAFEVAERELAGLDLAEALERTLAEREPVLFDALAARWIDMAFRQRLLTLHHLDWAAERFREVLPSHLSGWQALWRLLD